MASCRNEDATSRDTDAASGNADAEVQSHVLSLIANDSRARAAVLSALDSIEHGVPLLPLAPRDEPPTLIELMKARDEELRDEADASINEDCDGDSAYGTKTDLYFHILHDRAAWRIQSAWRMHTLGHDPSRYLVALGLDEDTALEVPRLDVAKGAALEMLPHRADGELYDSNEGLSSFDGFGVEVACYMRFVTYAGRACLVALLLNLSNIISNLDGGPAEDLLARHSLNNADCLGYSYGCIEALTSALFVGFCFWVRNETLSRAAHIRREEESDELLTAANCERLHCALHCALHCSFAPVSLPGSIPAPVALPPRFFVCAHFLGEP